MSNSISGFSHFRFKTFFQAQFMKGLLTLFKMLNFSIFENLQNLKLLRTLWLAIRPIFDVIVDKNGLYQVFVKESVAVSGFQVTSSPMT